MIIDTSSIKDGCTTINRSTALEEYQSSLPLMRGKVECEAVINRVQSSLFIQLHFTGVFSLQCSRCLNNYNQDVVSDCRLILEERSGCCGVADEADVADYYFNEEQAQVDISAYIFDEIMTSFPLMPLCSDLCKGIQPKVSRKDAGDDKCDPRWDALRKLREKK